MAPQSVRSLVVDNGGNAEHVVRDCSTISELHSVIPLSFRPALGEYLTKVYRIATKAGNVANTLAQYNQHDINGTCPPFIQNTIKVPKIQFSNEFDGTPEGRSSDKTLAQIVKGARELYLKKAIAYKVQEQTVLLTALRYNPAEWHTLVEDCAKRLAASLGSSITLYEDPEAAWKWSGTSVPIAVKQEAQGLWNNGLTYHTKAIGIARAAADKALLQRMKNMSMKDKSASEKMDVDSKDLSVKDTIEEALKKFEQKLSSGAITVKNKPTGPPKGGRKKGQNPGGGRNKGRINKSPPKKKQKKRN